MTTDEFALETVRRFFPLKGVSVNRKFTSEGLRRLFEDFRLSGKADIHCPEALTERNIVDAFRKEGFAIMEDGGLHYFNATSRDTVAMAEFLHPRELLKND